MSAPRLSFSQQRLALLDSLLRSEGLDRAPVRVISPRPDPTRPVPLTAQQTQLWLLDQIMRGPNPYVIPGGLRMRGAFDAEAFAVACRAVVRRHESLRTVFRDLGDGPRQIVRADLPPELTSHDLTSHDLTNHDLTGAAADAVAAEIRRRQRELALRPFDLARGPLLRVELLRVAPTDTVVLFTMHHIVSDLWSMGVLMREVMAGYVDAAAGRAPVTAPLDIQYPDFAEWQAGAEVEAGRQAELDHWVERLRDAPPDAGLVSARPRPAEKSHRGAAIRVDIPVAVAERVRRLAHDRGATPFMVLTAVFNVLLARLGGRPDVVVGTPTAGRPMAELEPLIGYFVNTLALRTDLSGNPTFREVVDRTARGCLAAFDRQGVPFERIVSELRPDRSLGRNPIFQVLFSYQNAPLPRWETPGLRVEMIPDETVAAKFDLQLDLMEDAGALRGRLGYSTDLFDEAWARDVAGCLQRLASVLTADPEQRVDDVPLLSAAGRREVLAWGRGPRVIPAAVGGVHELFEERVAVRPDDPALVAAGWRLSYADLDRRADELAARLRRAGAGGGLVGLHLPTGADLIVGVLAAWKAGAGYLPIDIDWPADRVAWVLEDSSACAVVGAPDDPTGELAVTALPAAGSGPGDADGLAYVIYTSGSTGRPKGVEITHAALLNYLAGVPERVGLGGPGRRYALLQGAVTDFANTVVHTALTTGGVLHIVDRHTAIDPSAVAEYLARERIDYVKVVPSHLAALTAEVGPAALWPARTLVLGGEAASVRQVADLCRAAEGRRLFNHYGPTETTIGVATAALGPAALDGGFVPLGRPVPNTNLYVLDARGEPVPAGVAGELYVGGAQVARGYRGRPDLTAERFRPDPFAADGSRMYRTGDRACWRHDGTLRFLGRVDHQLKIRGFRIEPQEIEAVLAAEAGVERAVVHAREDAPGGRRLVAYVTGRPGAAPPEPARLRAAAGRALPDHMVPSAVVVLDELPLTSNGKVDRDRLPAPEPSARPASRGPATPAEAALCAAFAEVLGLAEVGAEDDFFDLGGDSIQAIQLVSRARAAGLALDTRDIFVHQTPAALAAAAGEAGERPPATHDDGVGVVPALPVVERLRALGAPIETYSHRIVVPVPAEADEAGLAAALRAVRNHHGALRAALVAAPDGAWQLIVPPVDDLDGSALADPAAPAGGDPAAAAGSHLRRVPAAGLSDADFRRLLTAETAAAVARLDPWSGATVQAVWFDAGAAPGRLLLVIHHLVVDGVSWRVLLADLRAAWEAGAAGAPVTLPPVGTSLRRWADVVAAEADRPARAAELPGWLAVVRDQELLAAGPHDPAAPVRRLTTTLPGDVAEPLLTRVPRAFGAGVQDVLLAAFGLAQGEWRRRRGRRPAVVVEVEGHGRRPELADGLDLTRTVGWLTSVHPVRLDGPDLRWPQVEAAGPDLRGAVARLAGQARAVPGDGLGFGILRRLQPRAAAELAATPVPEVVFNYLGRQPAAVGATMWEPMAEYGAETTDATAGLGPLLTRPLHVNVYGVDAADGMQLRTEWTWPAPAWAAADLDELADLWSGALRAVVACAGVDAADAGPAGAAPAGAGLAGAGPAGATTALVPVSRAAPLPLSFPQLNNIFQPADSDHEHHNVIAAIVLRPRPGAAGRGLDEAALAGALTAVAGRHEVLRTRIRRDGPHWVQEVDPRPAWPVRAVDLRATPAPDRPAAVRAVIRAEQSTPFVLAEGRPARSVVVRVADHEWLLVMVLHHIVIDPWGYARLQAELAECYEAAVLGRAPRLPELGPQYPDFAAWQQRRLAGGALAANLAYWDEVFRDYAPLATFAAPAHLLGPPMSGFTQGFDLDEAATAAVKAAARRCGATPFMFLLAAYHALQSIFSGRPDVLSTFPLAGREEPATHPLVGYFISEVAVRTRAGWADSFRALVAQTRDGTLNAHAYQEVPLRMLHGGGAGAGAGADGGAGADPFRVMFNLVNYEPFALDLYGLEASASADVGETNDDAIIPEIVTAMRPVNLDLYLAMHERGGRLSGIWLFSPDRIDPAVMAAMTRAWPRLLTAVTEDPDRTLDDLRRLLLAPDEQAARP